MEVWVFYGAMFVAAAMLAVTTVLVLTTGLHIRTTKERYTLPLLTALLAMNLALSPVLNGRDLRMLFMGLDYLPTGFQSAWAAYIGKGLTYLTVIIAAIEVLHQIVQRNEKNRNKERILIFALLMYFFGTAFLPGLLGAKRGLEHFHFYLPLLFSAVYFSAGDHPIRVAKNFRNAIAGVLVATIGAIVVVPDMVMQQNFRGAIPLFSFRVWGLAAHPNAFAPLALTFLILLKTTPYTNRTINTCSWVIGIAAVLTAQSKTVWLIALALLAISHMQRIASEMSKTSASVVSVGIVGGSALTLIGIFVLGIVWALGVTDLNLRFLNEVDTKSLSTLTGRDQIWEITLREWRSHPIFGYGLTLWGDEYRRAMSMPTAFHAHNQFVQTMGAAGTIGLISLIVYLLMLFWGAAKVSSSYKPLAYALLLMLMVRSFSEPPFEMKSIADANVVLHLCLYALIVASIRGDKSSSRQKHGS